MHIIINARLVDMGDIHWFISVLADCVGNLQIQFQMKIHSHPIIQYSSPVDCLVAFCVDLPPCCAMRSAMSEALWKNRMQLLELGLWLKRGTRFIFQDHRAVYQPNIVLGVLKYTMY